MDDARGPKIEIDLMDDARGPKIDPSERTQQPIVKAGIGGGASLSMQRRTLDSRFARRYFVGYGIDVGGGDDSLHQFVELFPLIENVFVYDKAQGDAQKLDNVDDAASISCFPVIASSTSTIRSRR